MTESSKQIRVEDPVQAVREWFERINENCPKLDFDSTEHIFAHDVVGFGTKASIVSGMEKLRKNQWERLWPTIRDYQIDLTTMRGGGTDEQAWGIATWTSTGFDQEGNPFPRPGRVTLVLERREGAWLAVHTHFSVDPGTPPHSYGPDGKR